MQDDPAVSIVSGVGTRRVEDDDGKVWFVIDGVPSESAEEEAAIHLGFADLSGAWGRGFRRSDAYLDQAYEGFARLAAEMLRASTTRSPGAWIGALEAALERAESVGVEPFVVGSAALAAHGVDLVPGDIDLVVTEEEAHVLGSAFSDVLVEPVAETSGWICRVFGRSFVESYCVEWAGGIEDWVDDPDPVDFGPDALARSVLLHWRGRLVRVPPLDVLRNVNARRGRADRVAAIDTAFR